MAFYGSAFVFDSTPCELYDLMMYDIGNQDEDVEITGVNTIEDETIGDKWKPYFYGTRPGAKLEFDITFGVNERRLDEDKYLDDWEIAEITSWLCGHKEYKWLYIDQMDKLLVGYKCMISNLRITRYGSIPWALTAHVTCDSPYAYLEAKEITYTVDGAGTIEIYNESSLNDWYCPKMTFTRTDGTAFSVKNEQDGNRGPALTDIPSSVTEIMIDNENYVIENDQAVNLYEGFNFEFLRLARGYNNITIEGTGTLTITCEFPINVGG